MAKPILFPSGRETFIKGCPFIFSLSPHFPAKKTTTYWNHIRASFILYKLSEKMMAICCSSQLTLPTSFILSLM